MISAINSSTSADANANAKNNFNYDLTNISPNELEKLIDTMYKNNEISLKDTLAFKPLSLRPLAEDLNIPEDKIKITYSDVWSNRNTKRNMLDEYKALLQKQINNNDSEQNITFLRNAVSLLEKIQTKYGSSFKDELNSILQKSK